MTEHWVRYLVQQFLDNSCTQAEKEELAQWIEQSADDPVLEKILRDAWTAYQPVERLPDFKAEAILSGILSHREEHDEDNAPSPVRLVWLQRLSVAAVLMLFISTAAYYFYSGLKKDDTAKILPETIEPLKPVPVGQPGTSRATLTLADGARLILDSTRVGNIGKQGNMVVLNENNKLRYEQKGESEALAVFNSLSTSRGETYPVKLSDGTMVWLNSASSLKFPVAFNSTERVVELTGEAYFEVTKDASRPFRVRLDGTEIEVLGTHFNVNGYQDESLLRTTLLEGAVRVTSGATSLLLKPGNQATRNASGQLKLVKSVDLEGVTAWKDGYFHFKSADLHDVMRQLSRWYNVDVEFENPLQQGFFSGYIDKGATLVQVMKILEKSQLKLKLNDNKMIVLQQQGS